MARYYGVIKSKKKALAIAHKLRENGSEKARSAAALLENNWQSIASRPAIQSEIIALAKGLDNE